LYRTPARFDSAASSRLLFREIDHETDLVHGVAVQAQRLVGVASIGESHKTKFALIHTTDLIGTPFAMLSTDVRKMTGSACP
jgi:hypothetical protein